MIDYAKQIVNAILTRFGYRLLTLDYFNVLKKRSDLLTARQNENNDIQFLLAMPSNQIDALLHQLSQSQSQYRQDLFVLSELNFKRNGFFVEFGATNGVGNSNTLILEKEYGWNGILAEPARRWHNELKRNRKVNIETDCVWSRSGERLKFMEVTSCTELSTLKTYSSSDLHSEQRNAGMEYMVNTISLVDLLIKYKAPKVIDYLSIDTEGSEYEILSNFDFKAYSIQVITCEHNYTADREKIHQLLSENGYIRKCQIISNVDDWYVKSDITHV